MKKLTSILIIAVLCLSSTLPIFAQTGESPLSSSSFNARRGANILDSLSALSDGNGVWLEWRTAGENEILGFYVYRVTSTGKRQLVSPALVPGEFLTSGQKTSPGRRYNHFDPQGGATTGYIVESIDVRGERQNTRAFYPQFVADLTAAAGASSAELQKRAASGANPNVQKNDLELPPDVAAEVVAAASRPAAESAAAANATDPGDTQKWIAAQPAAKIGVRLDGLYRVTRAQLQTAGFNVNAPAANWQLYADGVEQSIIVGPNGDYIEFYGRGLDLTESDTRIYYLVAGAQPGRRMQTTVHRNIGPRIPTSGYQQVTVYEDRYNYLNQILNGEQDNFYGRLITSTQAGTTPVTLSGVNPASGASATVEVAVQGLSYTIHQYRVLLNGTEIGTFGGINTDLMTGTYTVPVSLLQEGTNNVRIEGMNPGETAFTDSIKFSYARRYLASQNQLSFYTQNYRQAVAYGFTAPDIRVFDMGDPVAPREVLGLQSRPSAGGGHEIVMPSYRARVLYAVAGAGVRTPAFVTSNAPSTLSTPANNANMVIISYKDWMTQAENWANYRRADNLTVKVINVEDIYDEFGYGVATADSIRAFLNYAKNNWQTAPGYVLLVGDTTYDPRNYLNQGYLNFVPAKIVDTTFMETGSDDALADFNDDGLAELAVGRVPARDAQTVTTLLSKTAAFEQGLAQAPGRGALCASDEPNGYDFQGLCNRVFQSFPGTAGVPQSHINRGAPDSRTQLLNAVNSGKYIINYSGHGTVGSWEGNWFSRNDVPTMTNTNANQTIWVMLTCLNGYYVDAYVDGLAEALVKKPVGGAVASWTSSGKTTPDIQELMAKRFYDQIATNATMNRIGDLSNDAKSIIPGGRDVRLSWVLIGDPALKIKP